MDKLQKIGLANLVGFEGFGNGVLVVVVSNKLFIICLHIRYFCDVCILILLGYPYFSSKIRY